MYSPNELTFSVDNFLGGLNTTKPETDIHDNQSPNHENVLNNEFIGINSRYGYSAYYNTALGTTAVKKAFIYDNGASADFILQYNNMLMHDNVSAATAIYSGMATTVRDFQMEGNIYFLDGSGYIQYNGTVATAVSGYIPTTHTQRSPDGTSGTAFEELNYLQSGFEHTFNGNGTATAFYMAYGSLTTGATHTVEVNGTAWTLSAASMGFTVNEGSGIFNLTTAPATGTDNVAIVAYASILDNTEIINATLCTTYGDGSATRAYFAKETSSIMYWSDIADPTYVPESNYAYIGIKNDFIKGMIPHGGDLIITKKRSIYKQSGDPTDSTIREVYIGEGCIAPDSLRIVDGLPTFLSQRGVAYLTHQGDVEYYQSYRLPILSEDVNGRIGVRSGIMTESEEDRQNSFAHVFDNKYFLYVNDKVFIYQYNLINQIDNQMVYPWVKWTDITAYSLIDKDDYLYFAGEGNIYKFDPDLTEDNGTAISSDWYSRKFTTDVGHDWIKWFTYIYFDFRILYANSNVNFAVYVDNNEVNLSKTSFSVSYWNPNAFNPWAFNPNATETNVEVRVPIMKKGKNIQFRVYSNSTGSKFTLLSAKILYIPDRKAG